MTIDDLAALLDYHYWALHRMLDAVTALPHEQYCRDLGGSFPSVRETLVHTYSAEWVWHERWLGHSPTALLSADVFPDLAALRQAWTEQEQRMRALVASAGADAITRRLEYRLISGAKGASTLEQVLQHVVNHATYHRGQVTTMLRQLGAAPPLSTDLIQFWRERDGRDLPARA